MKSSKSRVPTTPEYLLDTLLAPYISSIAPGTDVSIGVSQVLPSEEQSSQSSAPKVGEDGGVEIGSGSGGGVAALNLRLLLVNLGLSM